MDKIELQTTPREILGKKVRFLRRQGIIPVHLFGHNIESAALQCDTKQLQNALAQAGRTRLIGLKVDKSKKPRNVVVREIQREPHTGELIHVDFYQVSMAEKIRVDVPIVTVGEAPALKLKENFLTQELNSLTIECLPDTIPASVELDVSSLTEVDQAIHVEDIKLGEGITVLNNPEQMVVKISARHIEEEEVEEVVEEEEVEVREEVAPPEEESKEETS
jgi:large subunit ribosomal protein L25